jgi:hypothetical protein
VLDHVERRRFLVQPAREDPLDLLVGALDVDLDECAGQFLLLPRSARFAGTKPDDDVLPAHRLAGMKAHVPDDAVALVEDSKNGDALTHRRDARLIDADRRRGIGDHRGRTIVGRLLAARRNGRKRQDCERASAHV